MENDPKSGGEGSAPAAAESSAPPRRDRAGELIERLLGLRDPAFDPPPFDAAVAESVLGASGRSGTPHRRLLERANGAYLHDHALHLFGACGSPAYHSLAGWNASATFRAAYGDAAAGLVFFAEDAFGDQFAYTGVGGEVVVFEAELGHVETVAPTFVDWLEEMVERPDALLPLEVMAGEQAQGRRLRAGWQLFAWPPLAAVEAQKGVTLGHVDAIEAMRFRGELSRKLRALPPGRSLELDVAALLLAQGDDPGGRGGPR